MTIMNDLKNYYEVLEIPSTARSEEIYHSYQRAKSAYSSDSLALYSLMSPEECRNVLELVEEAYSILSDPMKRKRYDEARGINREFNALNYNTLSDRVPPARSELAYRASTSSSPVSSMLREEFTINSPNSAPISTGEMSLREAQTLSNTTNVTKLVTQKRFALDYVVNAEFEHEIENATEFTGDFLRKIREYKSVDLERLSDMTKVSRLYLQAIESEDYDKLPASVYVRGFVFQYAKCLKLKPEIIANSYIARMKKLKP
ncbi:MAG: helix-turn-helix domain-containing protein [Bacteriovorax sp.]